MELVAQRIFGTRHRLIAFGCVHFGDEGFDEELFDRCLEEIDSTPNAIVIGMGDYTDFSRTSYRTPMKAVWGEDDSMHLEIDTMFKKTVIDPLVWKIRNRCKSFSQKCIGLIQGNHDWVARTGITGTQTICEMLGVRYLGLSAYIRLTCYRSRGNKKMGSGHNLNIVANHSTSNSGSLPASLAAANRRLIGWRDVDVFLSGNDHQLGVEVREELTVPAKGHLRLVQKEVVIAKTGSFQRGYIEGATSSNYVEKKLLRPSHLGWFGCDLHIYRSEYTKADKEKYGVDISPEVWRFTNFSA